MRNGSSIKLFTTFFINSEDSTSHSGYKKTITMDKISQMHQYNLPWSLRRDDILLRSFCLKSSCFTLESQHLLRNKIGGISLRVSILRGCGCTLHTLSVYQPNPALLWIWKNRFHTGKSSVSPVSCIKIMTKIIPSRSLTYLAPWKVTGSQ